MFHSEIPSLIVTNNAQNNEKSNTTSGTNIDTYN